jgi:hypothetical protein
MCITSTPCNFCGVRLTLVPPTLTVFPSCVRYRAKYVVQAAKEVVARGGEPWLLGLRAMGAGEEDEVRAQLLSLMGVGRKVADCVALMSLDRGGLVPIDVHMARIGDRDYRFKAKDGPALADAFRGLWGEDAGWAQVWVCVWVRLCLRLFFARKWVLQSARQRCLPCVCV